MVAGMLAVWGGYLVMWHGKSLNFSLSALGSPQLYGMTYAGAGSALVGVLAGHAWRLFLALAVASSAYGLGLMALAVVRVPWPDRGLKSLVALGAGFSLLGLALLGLGLAGLWYGWVAALVVAGGCAAVYRAGLPFRSLVPAPARDAGAPFSWG
jgi:hypothetical protein